jgi:hypothetical protein
MAAALVVGGALATGAYHWGRTADREADGTPVTSADRNPVMNTPDKYAWQLCVALSKPAGNGSPDTVWEAWASDDETFPAEPDPDRPPPWPGNKHRVKELRPSAKLARANLPEGVAFPHVDLPGDREEVRRNKSTFDYIMTNKLWYVEGLVAAYKAGLAVSFPVDSIEIKAHWKPIAEKEKARFHWNTDTKGRLIGLTALHITTKDIPNWFWASWEHVDNPDRGKDLGCQDTFGIAPPNRCDGKPTEALKAMFKAAGLGDEWLNYRLAGTQTGYVDSTGRPVRMGNSIIEPGLVKYSSCMTCHAMARAGPRGVEDFRFDVGPPNPLLFYDLGGKPKNVTLDFVWGFMFAQPAKKGAK